LKQEGTKKAALDEEIEEEKLLAHIMSDLKAKSFGSESHGSVFTNF
jgi:hypothetical protein